MKKNSIPRFINLLSCLIFSFLLMPTAVSPAADFLSSPITQQIKRNPANQIFPQDLQTLLRNKEEIILVDVRGKKDFEKIRIPESLNIPLHRVKTKPFLKNKSVVLVNQGYNYLTLETECQRLIARYGFSDIRILYGGLCLWRDSGGELTGGPFALEELDTIPARDFYIDRRYNDWIIVNVAAAVPPNTDTLTGISIHVPYSGDIERLAQGLKDSISTQNDISVPYVLIFNKTGQDYKPIKKAVRNAGIQNVFYLQDGLDGYRSFIQKLALQRQPEKKKTAGCEVCP